MNLHHFKTFTSQLPSTPKMPVLFLGHGSPMNAIEENKFVQGWREIGQEIPRPNAILCISAHWETKGTKVTNLQYPPTIHDFYGFPKELFAVEYPAPGLPALAKEIADYVDYSPVGLSDDWGFDHGAWSVIKFLYANADVPMLELSLDVNKSPQEHYELAKELQALRYKGVLIVGSGNVVHNLRTLDWHSPNTGFDWAEEANEAFKKIMLNGHHSDLFRFQQQAKAHELAVPTPEHYLPAVYALALQTDQDEVTAFNDELIYGSLGMLSFKIG